MKRVLDIAKACHAANRVYCDLIGELAPHVSWDEAPEWQKQSAIAGVELFFENPNSTPEKMHTEWLNRKLADGWTFGPNKDAEKKEHPCLVPYETLPPNQRFKDYLFLVMCRTFVEIFG